MAVIAPGSPLRGGAVRETGAVRGRPGPPPTPEGAIQEGEQRG